MVQRLDEYLAKRIEIGYEIGDVLWYCAVLAEELEMNLGHIMEKNLRNLQTDTSGKNQWVRRQQMTEGKKLWKRVSKMDLGNPVITAIVGSGYST